MKEEVNMKQQFTIHKMGCTACASRIEEAIKQLPDVLSATVDFATKTLVVEVEKENTEVIVNTVSQLGYEACY